MNTLKACATYVEEGTTEHGIRYIEVAIPPVGKGEDVKVRIIPNKAAGDVLGSCSKGANLLIAGRLYRNRAVQGDYNSYLIPTQRIQVVSIPVPLNDVTIAGAYWLSDNDLKANQNQDRHNFTMLTSAPTQQLLSHNYDDTISFSVTSWKYDAERILQTAFKGRQMLVEGYLRSYNGYVSVTVRNGLVEMFGRKEMKEKVINSKPDYAPGDRPKVVIEGETKEELPI
jgi:hypothetical protein|tara:strand:- start:1724 stop:2404 length:681 start_codon:yes stop_codon:yes gene_type:complete